jgi:dTDP-4-amino-4,6-dideoxygalactose transaminase
MDFLKAKNIETTFHYIPLHLSSAGKKFGKSFKEDEHTKKESERLLRLPMYYDLKPEQVDYITGQVERFFHD